MITRLKLGALILASFVGLLAGSKCYAQFAGDVFFDSPSVSAQQNEVVVLDLMAFGGSAVFGAAQVEIYFDDSQVELVSVEAGDNELSDFFEYKSIEQGVAVIALNGYSNEKPIGTVALAKLQVKPIAPEGSIITVTTQIVSMLNQSSATFGSSVGYSAEIIVEPGGTASSMGLASSIQSLSVELAKESESAELKTRALKLRPEGATVELKTLQGSTVVSQPIKTGSGTSEDVIVQ